MHTSQIITNATAALLAVLWAYFVIINLRIALSKDKGKIDA